MDIATLAGLGMSIGLVVFGILSNGVPFGLYVHVPSVLIVIGGSLGAVMAANPLSRILAFGKYMGIVTKNADWKEEKLISDIVAFAEKARREGLLSLEDGLDDVEEEFMRKGIQLVVDGSDPEIIKDILYSDLNQIQSRHEVGAKLFADWANLAPAFGMIGTLVGLIAMLANLNDQAGIASGMATALITTLYGSMLANILLLPVRAKLEDRDRWEVRAKEIIIEGILGIQSGDNPRVLLEKLVSYLPPKEREAIRADSVRD